jgi:hypothetical protein
MEDVDVAAALIADTVEQVRARSPVEAAGQAG